MRKLALGLAFIGSLFASAAAFAADLPVKALPQFMDYPLANGMFWGGNASGLAGTTGSSAGIASGNLIGAKIGADIGYTWALGTGFAFIEQNFNLQAIQGPGNGLSVAAQFGMEQRYAYGVTQDVAAKFASLIPGLSSVAMPSLPVISGVTFSPASYYVFAATYEDDVSATLGTATGKSWLFSYGAGVGTLWRSNKLFVVDISVEWKHSDASLVIGAKPFGTVKPFSDAGIGTVRWKF